MARNRDAPWAGRAAQGASLAERSEFDIDRVGLRLDFDFLGRGRGAGVLLGHGAIRRLRCAPALYIADGSPCVPPPLNTTLYLPAIAPGVPLTPVNNL